MSEDFSFFVPSIKSCKIKIVDSKADLLNVEELRRRVGKNTR
jgi:hypothetical protein